MGIEDLPVEGSGGSGRLQEGIGESEGHPEVYSSHLKEGYVL